MNQCDEKHRSPTRNTPQPRAFRDTKSSACTPWAEWRARVASRPKPECAFASATADYYFYTWD